MPTDINAEIESLRSQGLTDNLIQDELTRQGHPTENVEAALSQNDIPVPMPGGGLDDYDSRMTDVGTELKAVGRVFKEVIPEFVENVKELKSITGKKKARTEGYEGQL